MAAVSHSRTSRNIPIRDAGIPELPAPPLGGGKSGRVSGEEEQIVFAVLLDAAMQACDYWQDSPQARQAMRAQLEQTPPHLHRDLTDHFRQSYPQGAHE